MSHITADTAESTILGIDIGTTKIAAVVVRVDTDYPEILGVARVPFEGSIFADPDMTDIATAITANTISWAVRVACKAAGCSTQSAIIGFSGYTKGHNSEGIININGQVSGDDIQKALAVAADFTVPKNMVMLDQVINSFSLNLDEAEGIVDPLGMDASSLAALSHNVLGRMALLDKITASCKLAGLNILKTTSSVLAAAEILLTKEDKEKGVCLLDIGGDYASLVIYQAGALKYTASVPWGGNLFTDRIKFRLGMNVMKAEQVKLVFSRGESTDEQCEAIRTLLDRELLVLCSHLDTQLYKSGLEENLTAGIVLTGGTGDLPGLSATLERVLQVPVRRAEFPFEPWLKNIPVAYASAVGLILRGFSRFGEPVNIS